MHHRICSICLFALAYTMTYAQDSPRIEMIRKLYYRTMEFQDLGMVDSTEYIEKLGELKNGQSLALHVTYYDYPGELWRIKVFSTGENSYSELYYYFLGTENYFIFENTASETCLVHYRHYYDEFHRRIKLLSQDNDCNPFQALSKNQDITNQPDLMLLESAVDDYIDYAKRFINN